MFRQSFITDINDRATIRAPIASTILALACLAGLWFVAFAFLPKTEALAKLAGTQLPPSFTASVGTATVVRTLLYPVGILVLLAFMVSMAGAISFPIRRFAGAFIRFVLLILVPVMGVLMIVSWIGLYYVFEAERMRATSYERALAHFSLNETIHNRFDKAYGQFKSLENLEPVEIRDVDVELPPSEKLARLQMLSQALEEANDAGTRKRLLATLPPFETLIAKDEAIRSIVMNHASQTARESFEDLPDFFRWLGEQSVSDGWEPIPLYRFETR